MKPVAAARCAPTLLTWLALAIAGLYPIDNPDTFGHLALGRQIVELGHVPKLDAFSYFRRTPAPFVNYEWLSDWLFFQLLRAGGWAALHGLKLAVAAVLAWLLVRIAQLRAAQTGAWLVPLFTFACLPAIRFRLSIRPHLLGLALAALLVLGLSEILTVRERRTRLAWVGALGAAHVLWVNLHGSHLLGLALTLIALISSLRLRDVRGPLSSLLGLMLGASCISPYGPQIVVGAVQHSLDPRYRALIDEWGAYHVGLSLWYPAVFGWQLLWLGIAFRVRPPSHDACRRFEALYTLLLLLMAARSMRFYAETALLTVPVIASGLAPAWSAWPASQRARRTGALSLVGAALAIGGCLSLPPQASFGFGVSTRGRPEASAQWLAAHLPRARILATMADAWDLMFSLPHAQFLVDGRAPFYGPEHLRRLQRAWAARDSLRQLIDETGTDVVVVQPMLKEQQTALHALRSFADFRLVSIEAEHCVFLRLRPQRETLLQRTSLHVLRPGYEPGWLLSPDLDQTAVHAELGLLPDHPNVGPYRAWVEALLSLRPFARAQGRAGLAPARGAGQRAALLDALGKLRTCDRALPFVQTISAYRALAAVASCQLDEAEAAFARALESGPVREIGFGLQELALRRDEPRQVAQFLSQARTLAQGRSDPWVTQLEAELSDPPVCPAH